jgi:hypothetical protein
LDHHFSPGAFNGGLKIVQVDGCKIRKVKSEEDGDIYYHPEGDCPWLKDTKVQSLPDNTELLIKEWKTADWLKNDPDKTWKSTFDIKNSSITVKEDGIYYIYTQYLFFASGPRCSYRVHYGPGKHDFVRCIADGQVADGPRHPNTFRPCFLGFAQRMAKDSKLELKYFEGYQQCKADTYSALRHGFMGIIQLRRL